MRWTLWRERRTRVKRTAKSCGPDIPTLISGATRERCHPRRHKSPVSGASTKETVKTVRAGNAGMFGVPVVDLTACFHSLHAELRVRKTPGIPCALSSREGQRTMYNSGADCVARRLVRI